MMSRTSAIVLGFVVTGAVGQTVIACSSADLDGPPIAGDDAAGAGATQAANTQECVDDGPPLDPATLPSCCTTGAAHCVPESRISPKLRSSLDPCAAGRCVPDPLIRSEGAAPPECKSLNDAPGVCLSVCVPMVAQYKDLLPRATCAEDERCAPCVSPLDNQPTGACDIGKTKDPTCDGDGGASGGGGGGGGGSGADASPACPHQGPPVVDPTKFPACGPAPGAHCVSTSLVPASMAQQLATCPTGLCVPDPFIEAGGNFVPPTCTSVAGAEGRCLHLAIPAVAAQAGRLPQATCATNERCVPCVDPVAGTDTGACHLSCDPGPTKPPVALAGCCDDANGKPRGKCLPSSAVPQDEQSQLDQKNCANDTDLCVPTENLSAGFAPPKCAASNFLSGSYAGVCLSACLDFGIRRLGISRGNCDQDHLCVPCTSGGKPTGAPGCGDAGAP